MKKEQLLPIDLGNLENKVWSILQCFEKSHMVDRSEEYKEYHLKKAEDITKVLSRDFSYYFDTKMVGGIEPYNLSEFKEDIEENK